LGGLVRRLKALEGSSSSPERPERTEVRARMKAVLDEIATARREGREPSEEAMAVMEAIKRRRECESA
jgi:hypothetical protein